MDKIFMVSLGSGEIDNITIKALESLKQSKAICVLTKSKDSLKKSISYKIVDKLFKKYNFQTQIVPIFAPMQYNINDWKRETKELVEAFYKYKIISFVTIGDASIYSTIYYLIDIIKQDYKNLYDFIEVIPGVTSFSVASAKIKKPIALGDDMVLIKPLEAKGSIKKIYLRPKVGKNYNINNCYYFTNLGLDSEDFGIYDKKEVKKYMTLFLQI